MPYQQLKYYQAGTFVVGKGGLSLTVHPFDGKDPNSAAMEITART